MFAHSPSLISPPGRPRLHSLPSRSTLFMAAKSGKTVAARIRLLIGAGAAKPAPPVGPALGQAGLNIMSFCKDFNAATAGIKV